MSDFYWLTDEHAAAIADKMFNPTIASFLPSYCGMAT